MSKRTEFIKNLNELDSSNVEFCEIITSSYKLADFFPDHPFMVKIFENYRSKKLNDLTLFWCCFISFMHWSSESKLYDAETCEYTSLKLFGILRGNSVSHKSGYIKPIREAFDFVERYYREKFLDQNNKFSSTCIESVTAAKLICELENSSKFVSSDEDRPLTDFCFFEPGSLKAKEIQPSIITAFNGAYKLQRSTMFYQKQIRDRSLTILVPTTGDRWTQLLEYFFDSYQTNGIYERFFYWVISKKNFVQDVHPFQRNLPSLEYLFITRMQIGFRIYQYDEDALAYIKPILSKIRHNIPCPELSTAIPLNKRAEACQRRSADLLERLAVVFQNILDTVAVLENIDTLDFHCIQKHTLEKIKTNIDRIFYQKENNDDRILNQNHKLYPDHIDLKELAEVQITSVKKPPSSSMKVSLSAAKAAVLFFDKLLMPQSIKLFNTDITKLNKILMNEFKIIQQRFICFSMSDFTRNGIFHNYKRDNVDVKQLLLNLEKKFFVKKGRYIKVGSRSIESWIKMLPDPTHNEEIEFFQNELYHNYQITLEQYINMYIESVDCNNATLNEFGEENLTTQKLRLTQLKQKLNYFAVKSNSAYDHTSMNGNDMNAIFHVDISTTTDLSTSSLNHHDDDISANQNDMNEIVHVDISTTTDLSTSSLNHHDNDISADKNIINSMVNHVINDTMDSLQSSSSFHKTTDSVRQKTSSNIIMNEQLSLPLNHGFDQYLSASNELHLINNSAQDFVIHDVLSTTSTQGKILLNSPTAANIDLIKRQEIISTINQTNDQISDNIVLSEDVKMLCKKILLINTVIYQVQKLNKCCKTNMTEVHKACQVLVENGLLSMEDKMLANKSSYYYAYLKKIPRTQVEIQSFVLILSKFDILNIDSYYETLKIIDTKNTTYITPYALSVFKDKPYNDLEVTINESAIIEPTTPRYRKLSNATIEFNPNDGADSLLMEINEPISTQNTQESQMTIIHTKRCCQLTSVDEEYQEQHIQSKRKKIM